MELGLILGQTPKALSLEKSIETDLGFCMAVGRCRETDPLLHLHLHTNNLPFTNFLSLNLLSEEGRRVEKAEEGPSLSSPFSTVSSFQMEISNNLNEPRGNGEASRKKLRLSKQQSAFLEDSFKEHTSLNPKEKVALAMRLNLRPRQVEVWFQNRRARTKLKQTEMDCEYLTRCCERLREENTRLQKQIHELRRAHNSNSFYMPPTTLTMCPSCQTVDGGAST